MFRLICIFLIFVSFKQSIWYANMFQYVKKSTKCNFNEWVFKDCIIIVSLWNFWNETSDNSYFSYVLRCAILSCTIGFTWKLFLDNGITRNHGFFYQEFGKRKLPIWFFCPHVQLDQSVNLDKSIWIQPFWLGLFTGLFYQVFFIEPSWQ